MEGRGDEIPNLRPATVASNCSLCFRISPNDIECHSSQRILVRRMKVTELVEALLHIGIRLSLLFVGNSSLFLLFVRSLANNYQCRRADHPKSIQAKRDSVSEKESVSTPIYLRGYDAVALDEDLDLKCGVRLADVSVRIL